VPAQPLLNSTANPHVDLLLAGLIGVCEEVFPGRLRAAYLTGSYADGSAIASSDLDLVVVFRGELEPNEAGRLAALSEYCDGISTLQLNLYPIGEGTLFRLGDVTVKLAGLHIWGENLRPAIPLPPLPDYRREMMHRPLLLLQALRHTHEPLIYPLALPNPAGRFHGYDRPAVRRAGPHQARTRELVTCIHWIATALLARTGVYAGTRRQCLALYRQHLGDEWATLIEDAGRLCRDLWRYSLPTAPADRDQLRALCRRALEFENHFLSHYRTFLLDELALGSVRDQLVATQRLGQVLFPDPAVADALRRGTAAPDRAIRGAAAESLRRLAPLLAPPRATA